VFAIGSAQKDGKKIWCDEQVEKPKDVTAEQTDARRRDGREVGGKENRDRKPRVKKRGR